jgi:anti-sigma factor RsiW
MLNNTNNNSSCSFAEEIIEHLYGESEAKEKSEFDAHVKSCSSCANELAAFGFVRASVLEWRDADFSTLELPDFNVPAEEISTVGTTGRRRDWFAEIKKLFVFQPALVTAALAFLFVCVGLALFALNFSKVDDLAEIDRNDVQKTAASPTVEKVVLPPAVNSTETPSETNDKTPAPEFVRQPPPAPVKAAIKVSNRAEDASTPVRENRENKDTKIRDKKSPPKKPQIPVLTDIDEVEDKTIRLADLFEEIGAE